MAIVKGISQAVVDSFKGSIRFMTKRGKIIAGKWPRKSTHKRSPAELFNWQAMRASQEATKTLKPSVREAFKLLASGTDFMWQDLFNSQFLKEYYKNREAPCYVRDFSYTKTGPRIEVEYELSKEGPHSITRHNISKYGVVIPAGNKMCEVGCKMPPNPEPDGLVEGCVSLGKARPIFSPELGIAKYIYAPETDKGYDWTWDWLVKHWPDVDWGMLEANDEVSWYGALGSWPPIYTGRIWGKKCTIIMNFDEEGLGQPLELIYKIWWTCEGSMNNYYISGFKCVETGDLVPLQAGKLAFGDLMPYLGEALKFFHMQPIEMPDPPTKPRPLEAPGEFWSGGKCKADKFRVHFCWESWKDLPIKTKWDRVRKSGYEYTQDTCLAFRIFIQHIWNEHVWGGSASEPDLTGKTEWWPHMPQVYAVWDRAKYSFDLTECGTEEEFHEIYGYAFLYVPLASTVRPRTQPFYGGGVLRVIAFGEEEPGRVEEWTGGWKHNLPKTGTRYPPGDYVQTVEVFLIPHVLLNYPEAKFAMEQPIDSSLWACCDPDITGQNWGWSEYRAEKPIFLRVFRKGTYPHIEAIPYDFNSPYWTKVSKLERKEPHPVMPVVSPFFRII